MHLATVSACIAPGPPQESLVRDGTRTSLPTKPSPNPDNAGLIVCHQVQRGGFSKCSKFTFCYHFCQAIYTYSLTYRFDKSNVCTTQNALQLPLQRNAALHWKGMCFWFNDAVVSFTICCGYIWIPCRLAYVFLPAIYFVKSHICIVNFIYLFIITSL